MRTKLSRSSDAQNVVVHFYLAEDMRQELSGKVSAIGLYTDYTVMVNLPDEAPDPSDTAPIVLKSLAFLFSISGFTKPEIISVNLVTEKGVLPFLASKEYPPPGQGRSMSLIAAMEPGIVKSFGKRKIVVSVGSTEHTFEYEIRRGSKPANADLGKLSKNPETSRSSSQASKLAPKKRIRVGK